MKCVECGESPAKKDRGTCCRCSGVVCLSHQYFRVDGNNGSITKHAPKLCRTCYLDVYRDEIPA